MYSRKLSLLYDQLMGDYSSITGLTKKLVTTYLPPHASILELGCGTGNVLELFKGSYKLSGLDNAEGMLEQAGAKVPQAALYLGDMRTFALPEIYDCILCIFDTINHLQSPAEITQTLRRVSKHLKPHGLFIVDMNTPVRMERLTSMSAHVGKLNKNTVTKTKITKRGKDRYAVEFEIFEDVCKNSVSYFHEDVQERVYTTKDFTHLLEPYFTVKKMIDPIRKRITSQTGRIFFVCEKN